MTADIAKLKALADAAVDGYCIWDHELPLLGNGVKTLLSRIEQLEGEQAKWNELVKAVRELRGFDDTWPDHGNAPLAIAAGCALMMRRIEELEKRVAELKEALRPFAVEFEERRDAYIRRYPRNFGVGASNFDSMPDDWKMENSTFTMGAYRRAREALGDQP